MHTFPSIPGVTLEVFKENRLVHPEKDGWLQGPLRSGFLTILATVDPNADLTVAFFRDGQDHYKQQRDWLLPAGEMEFPDEMPEDFADEIRAKQQRRNDFVRFSTAAGRDSRDNTVFGVRMPLRVNKHVLPAHNTVHYPENMLGLARYVREGGRLTGRVHIWEVAVVSQFHQFFLTVYRHYNIASCHIDGKTRLCYPRLARHHQLAKLLVDNAPPGLPTVPAEDFVRIEPVAPPGLGRYEGVVDVWYEPCGGGAGGRILTNQGLARVHFEDVPPRPRLRYLVPGERVKFSELRKTPKNPETEWRPARKSRIALQACGIEVA